MRTVELEFRFKGDRTYVHGTDMYNAMLGELLTSYPAITISPLRFTVHRPATLQCHLLVGEPGETLAKPASAVTELTTHVAEGRISAWLFEVDAPVTERYPYDEDRVETVCICHDSSIAIHQDSGYTPIETAVAMTKLLHRRLYPPDMGKWLFTRLELQRPLAGADTSRFAIHFLEDLGRGRLTKSKIQVGSERIGQIYFSARRP
jgi:hypothetical protein